MQAAGKIGNVMKGANLTAYVRGAAKTVGGNKTHDTGDSVAIDLRGLPIDEVYRIAADKLNVTVAELRGRYAALNVGMQRMNLGNRIRGAIRAAEKPAKPVKAEKPAKVAAEKPVKAEKAATPAKGKATVKIDAPVPAKGKGKK